MYNTYIQYIYIYFRVVADTPFKIKNEALTRPQTKMKISEGRDKNINFEVFREPQNKNKNTFEGARGRGLARAGARGRARARAGARPRGRRRCRRLFEGRENQKNITSQKDTGKT